uniref:Importin N-terminal domain-containing protein n=1 Tax=Lactuca sativa TaxID=4236 RepID=A0A9R1UXH6_LACSA|nr:hypothetical protein LSAT_V11C800390600 [Lactuca sativa]
MYEEVSPDVVEEDHVNKILTTVVQGMNASEGSNNVKVAATRALYNALSFTQANFSNDMERDYIMRVVCEATMQTAYECLMSISSKTILSHTRHLQHNTKAVKEDKESVALQAIEFWSSICDEEIDILEDYGGDFTGDSDIPCFYFIKQVLPALVPMLLETLLKQEKDQDQDKSAWNLVMAGGTCIRLVVRTIGDEGATYVFGSVLEGPSPNKLILLVNVALNSMFTALSKDPKNHVKDTTWTLGIIFEFLYGPTMEIQIVTPSNCQQIITILLQSMKDAPNVAEKV